MSHALTKELNHGEQRDIIVIGASAGGLEPLSILLAGLPADFPAAILVVRHLSPHSPSVLHQILGRTASLPVVEAEDAEPIHMGRIYVAGADRHLMVDGTRLRLTRGPKENFSRPSINVLFRSAAYSLGARVIGIVLSGMLDDGTSGLWAIKDRGGLALVQSPEEASHPSMPQSAREHVKVDAVLPVAEMPARLVEWTSERIKQDEAKPMSKTLEAEHHIALNDGNVRQRSMELGPLSTVTCPECHGAMVRIEEESIIRFRCHTGHAYSIRSLMADVNEEIDESLWKAIKVIEERIFLLYDMAKLAKHENEVGEYLKQIHQAEWRVEQLRQLVMASDELGHNAAEHREVEHEQSTWTRQVDFSPEP
jgi:two-component system, chemotaxis family, protein-glutamate methylesterase/glutaminase